MISSFVVEVIYKDIWDYKKVCLKHKNSFLKNIYYAYCQKYNSWIGLNSVIYTKPNLPHGLNGIFIPDRAIMGHHVTIFHQVTIGSNTLSDSKLFGSPEIGNHVFIGCGAKIIGNVSIGDFVRIGANCCVVKDIEHKIG